MRFLRSSSTGMNDTSIFPASSASTSSPVFGATINSSGTPSSFASAFAEIDGDAARRAAGILDHEQRRRRWRERHADAKLAGRR